MPTVSEQAVTRQQLNLFLTATTKEERLAVKEKHQISEQAILKIWNGGKICGQCNHYRPLGGNRNLNGTCSKVAKNDYTRPGDKSCREFNKVKIKD